MEMVEHHQSTRKTIRFNEITDDKQDHISLLPYCLLIDIISRLPGAKEAIRTGTLSKRWQHLWPYVSNLIFIFYMSSSEEWNHQRLSHIVSSIDKTLTQCRQFSLTKFLLFVSYDIQFQSHVNNWLRYVFSCNVQDLELSILNEHSESEFVLDQFFFINSSFTSLSLDGCVFNPDGVISWKNLTSLVIFQGKLDEGLIKNIISSSPLLEALYLVSCYGFERIDITSKSVKKLVIGGYNDPEDEWEFSNIVEIDAPHILSLRITMYFLLWKVVLLNVSSLVEAELDYEKGNEEKEEMLEDLIVSLRHVKKLQIGYNCLKTLGRLETKGFTFPSNLDHPDWPDYDYDSSGGDD